MSKRMAIKRCPYCSTNLNISDDRCFSCKHKVGDVNEYGLAQKPFDWKGYGMSILATIAFIGFMWWAFFRE